MYRRPPRATASFALRVAQAISEGPCGDYKKGNSVDTQSELFVFEQSQHRKMTEPHFETLQLHAGKAPGLSLFAVC